MMTQNADGTYSLTLSIRDTLDYATLTTALEMLREQVTEDAPYAPTWSVEPVLGSLDHLTGQLT